MKGERKNPEVENLSEKMENIERKINALHTKLEEIQEDLTYTVELIMKYQKLVEKSNRLDTLIVNILLFTVGVLLGFTIALLFFKA